MKESYLILFQSKCGGISGQMNLTAASDVDARTRFWSYLSADTFNIVTVTICRKPT